MGDRAFAPSTRLLERIGNGTKNEEDELNRKAFIPISALLGALLLALVAAMTPFVAERNVAHAQTAASITVGGERIAIGTEFEYTGPRVSSGTSHISVSAGAGPGSRVHSIRYASDITASTSVGAVAAADFATLPGTAVSGGSVPLRANESTDIGVVMATGTGDSMTGTIYVVTVTRVSSTANDDANLSALSISSLPAVSLWCRTLIPTLRATRFSCHTMWTTAEMMAATRSPYL